MSERSREIAQEQDDAKARRLQHEEDVAQEEALQEAYSREDQRWLDELDAAIARVRLDEPVIRGPELKKRLADLLE